MFGYYWAAIDGLYLFLFLVFLDQKETISHNMLHYFFYLMF